MKTAVLVVVTVALCGINLPQLGREMWFGQLRAKWEVSTVIVPLEPIRNQPATSLGIGNLVGRYRWGLQWRYGTVQYGIRILGMGQRVLPYSVIRSVKYGIHPNLTLHTVKIHVRNVRQIRIGARS